MATADLDFNIEITGTTQEVVSILEIMFEYNNGKDGVYFSFTSVNTGDKVFSLHRSNKDEILSAVRSSGGAVKINSSGPFGKYGELDDVDIFREMAQAAPGAGFTASINGFAGYADQSLKATLVDGLLHISTFYLSDDSRGDAELEYFSTYLPYKKFIDLFHLDGKQFDEQTYEDFIVENLSCCDSIGEFFEDTDYEEFIDLLDAECPLTEDEYNQVAQQFTEMDCECYEDYLEREGFAQCEEYTYDPVEKKYLNTDHPRMKAGVVYSINDNIRKYLQSIGHPSDDETIAALSVDDVYSIMAGTYGKESSTASEAYKSNEIEETSDAPKADECTGVTELAEDSAEADTEYTNSVSDDTGESAREVSIEADSDELGSADQESIGPKTCTDDIFTDAVTADTAEVEPKTASETENKSPAPKKSAPVWLIVLLITIILIGLVAFVFSLGETLCSSGANLLGIIARLR